MTWKSRFHLTESEKLVITSGLEQRMRIPVENRGRFRPPEIVDINVIAGWKWFWGTLLQDKPKKMIIQLLVLSAMLLVTCYQRFF